MTRILPPQDKELIPSFFADYQHVHGTILFGNFVQDAIIPQAKFPRRHRINTQQLNATRFLRGLMAQVKPDAVKDDPSGVSSESAYMTGRLIRNIDGIWLSQWRAQKTLILRFLIMTILGLPNNPGAPVVS
jgi:hypothetical protein